jgi:hypothetical protein
MTDEDFKKAVLNLRKDQTKEQLIATLQEEQMRQMVARSITFIKKPELRFPDEKEGIAPAPVAK